MNTHATDPAIHKFELSGLGKAPFRIMGCEEKRGPIRSSHNGAEVSVGAPGQPMGTCDYCGQGIAICWNIRSSDGKTFIVGSDCVAKTGDAGLKRAIQPIVRKMTKARDDARIEAAMDRLADVEAALRAQPHPVAFMAERGMTLFDSVEWTFRNAGNAGKIRAARIVESCAKDGA